MKTSAVKVEFKTSTVNAKNERVISFVVKGDLKDHQVLALDKLKGIGACFMDLYSSQADIEDYEQHDSVSGAEPQRIAYTLNGGEVDKDQLAFDDVIADGGDYVVVDENGKEIPGYVVGVDLSNKELNWLEQEELIAEQEVKEIEASQELSDELE